MNITHYTIENMEATSWLSNLEPGVDACFTDPPYSSGGKHRDIRASTGKKYCKNTALRNFAGETMDQRSYYRFSVEWLGLVYKALKEGGFIGVFCDWRQYGVVSDALQAAGFHWNGTLIWDKTEGVRPQKGAFRQQAEFVLWGTKGPRKQEGPILPGLHRAANITRDKLHQTQKPVSLMEWLVSITSPDALIIDPFMGSASTGIAALQTGRRFAGCEISPDIFKTASNRLAEWEELKSCA